MEKNKLMLKYMKILGMCFFGLFVFLMVPVLVAFPDIGKGMLMGMPPMLFMALSWMAGAWYAWDKGFPVFMALTLGAMPVRLGMGLLWTIFVMQIPAVNLLAFYIGMMVFWIAFTIPEFTMLIDFSNKFPIRGHNEV